MKKIGRILKKILLTLGIILFTIILAIIILHEVLLTPRFVKKQVVRIFKKTFNKDIKLERIDVSLVRGIEIDNVILFNPEYSSKRIFFKIDKLRIKYNLFYLALLKIKIDEILFDNPYIFLEYNNKLKKWNFDEYVKPSEKEEEKEEEKEPGSPLKIDIELKSFALKNFTFEFIKDMYFKLTGINYTANLQMDETSLQGINSASFKFFNTGNKNITFYNNTTKVIMPLNLNIDLDIKNNKDGKLKLTYN